MSHRQSRNSATAASSPAQRAPPPQCQFPPHLRFESYRDAFGSSWDNFASCTGGDAPWYWQSRAAAERNSRGFFSRFLASVGASLTGYAVERARYDEEQKKNREPQTAGEGEVEEPQEESLPPALPSEMQRLCAYVAVEHCRRHLFTADGTEEGKATAEALQQELIDLARSAEVQGDKQLSSLFAAVNINFLASSSSSKQHNGEQQQHHHPHPHQLTLPKPASVAKKEEEEEEEDPYKALESIKSSAMRAIMLEKINKQEEEKKKKKQQQAQQEAAAASTGGAAVAAAAQDHQHFSSNSQKKAPRFINSGSDTELAWADRVMNALVQRIASDASTTGLAATVPDPKHETGAATVPVPLNSLLHHIAHELKSFMAQYEGFVRDQMRPEAAAESYWTYTRREGNRNVPASPAKQQQQQQQQQQQKKKKNQEGEEEEEQQQDESNEEDAVVDDEDEDDVGGMDVDGDTCRPSLNRTVAEIAAASPWPYDVPRQFAHVGRTARSRAVQAPCLFSMSEIVASRLPLQENKNKNTHEEEQQHPPSPAASFSAAGAAVIGGTTAEEKTRFETINSILHGLIGTQRRSSIIRFAASSADDPKLFADYWLSQQTSEGEALAAFREYLIEQVQPVVHILAAGLHTKTKPPRLFQDNWSTADDYGTWWRRRNPDFKPDQRRHPRAGVNNKEFLWSPKPHAAAIVGTARTVVQLMQWRRLVRMAVAAGQLSLLASHGAMRCLSRFHNIVVRAQVASGILLSQRTSYEHDKQHGKAAARVGAEAEEEATLRPDLLAGVGTTLRRLRPELAWLKGGEVERWVAYTFRRWVMLEREVRKARVNSGGGAMSPASLLAEKERFVLLALELAEESEKQAAARERQFQPLPVWVPLVNASIVAFDGRDNLPGIKRRAVTAQELEALKKQADWEKQHNSLAGGGGAPPLPPELAGKAAPIEFVFDAAAAKNTARTYTSNELDIVVVNLDAAIKAFRTEKGKKEDAAPANVPPVTVEAVFEVKLAPTDIVKAVSQDQILTRCLATHVEWAVERRAFEKRLIQAGTLQHGTRDLVPVFYRVYATMLEDDCAFIGETVPLPRDLVMPTGSKPGLVASVAAELNRMVDAPPQPKLSKSQRHSGHRFFSISIDSFQQWAREEHDCYYMGNNVSIKQQIFSGGAVKSLSQIMLPPSAPVPKPYWQLQQQNLLLPARFIIVTKWVQPNRDPASSKFFPVLAQLKHAVVKNVAALLSTQWRGVQPPPAEIRTLIASRTQELKSKRAMTDIFPSMERAVRIATHRMVDRPLGSKKQERAALFAPLGPALTTFAADIDQHMEEPVTGEMLLGSVSHQAFLDSVRSIQYMWSKEAARKQPALMTPHDIYTSDYVIRDAILFVSFETDSERTIKQ